MSIKEDFQESFFQNELDETQIRESIKEIKAMSREYLKHYDYLVETTFSPLTKDLRNTGLSYIKEVEEDLKYLSRKVLIIYFMQHRMHTYFMTQEDAYKMETLHLRNDYKSKLFTDLLGYCIEFARRYEDDYQSIIQATKVLFKNELEQYLKQLFAKEGADLIKFLNKTVGRIKQKIIHRLYAEKQNSQFVQFYESQVLEALKEYLKTRNLDHFIYNSHMDFYGLEVNRFSTLYYLNEQLQKEINSKNNIYNLSDIIKVFMQSNDQNSLYKVLDQLFENLLMDEKYKDVIAKKLPLSYADLEYEAAVKRTIQTDLSRMLSFNDILKVEDSLYPIGNHAVNKGSIEDGKIVFKAFLDEVYQANSDQFLELFEQADLVIRKEQELGRYTQQELMVKDYYDFFSFYSRLRLNKYTKSYLMYLEPNFFEPKYALERFYNLCHILKKNRSDSFNQIVFTSLNLVIKALEDSKGIVPIRRNLIADYESKKKLLKKRLNELGYGKTSTEDYEVAFLDREVATLEQINRFKTLEQIGDAIYEYTLGRLLLWTHNADEHMFYQSMNQHVKAEAQVKIAKALDLEKYYIHYQILNKKTKFDYYEDFNERGYHDVSNKESYLADSLEMLIGAIYFEKGLEEARKFTKKVICQTFKELDQEDDHLVDILTNKTVTLELLRSLDENKQHMVSILKPSAHMIFDDNDMTYYYFTNSLIKLLNILVLGNHTREERVYLRNFNTNMFTREQNVSVGAFITYLYFDQGFDKAHVEYKKVIKKLKK